MDRFKVSRSYAKKNQPNIDWDYINETLFIVPDNDGEARRSLAILQALNVPFLHVSGQKWGATLDLELKSIDPELYGAVSRAAIFEIPGTAPSHDGAINAEDNLRAHGLEVDIIDHHHYKWVDRYHTKSSLEQLCERIGWIMNPLDIAIAVNDRSYIPGLRELGLDDAEIREIRKFDMISQGHSAEFYDKQINLAAATIATLTEKKCGDLWILDEVKVNSSILMQELSLISPDTKANVYQIRHNKLGFSGEPKVVKQLLEIDFTRFGYSSNYANYGGGDGKNSKFWGFKPKDEGSMINSEVKEFVKQMIIKLLEPK